MINIQPGQVDPVMRKYALVDYGVISPAVANRNHRIRRSEFGHFPWWAAPRDARGQSWGNARQF